MQDPKVGYRAEIDGLRAIAVVVVVLFHARVPGFGGGFVGVDVFFVISGFLITQLILRDAEAGQFSLFGFYERRVRRILPALLAVLAVSSLAALLMLPSDLKRFGASVVAVTTFLSNFLFWRWQDYFSTGAEATPLLHTWSLALEEQFYLLFPLALVFVRKRGPLLAAAAIALAALASFAFSVWATLDHHNLAFYSPMSRAWELMAGALLATGLLPAPKTRWLGDGLAGLGLAAIGLAVWRLTSASPFPGLNGLAPCLGAALVIHGAQAPGSTIARLLAARPAVAVGQASYSLYLWHWPMIVFGTYYVLNESWVREVRMGMAALSIPVAFLSLRYIERPFRGPGGLLSRRTLFVAALVASAAVAVFGAAVFGLNGLPRRFDAAALRLGAPTTSIAYPCANRPLSEIDTNRACILGDATQRPSFVLWGDSHAAMYHEGLDALARRHGVSGYSISAYACAPLLSRRPAQRVQVRECQARNRQVLALLAARRPRAVILAANWDPYFWAYRGEAAQNQAAARRRKHGLGLSRNEMDALLGNTVGELGRLGITVYFVEDVPAAAWTPERLAKAYVLGAKGGDGVSRAEFEADSAGVYALVSPFEQQGAINVLRPARWLCGPRICRITHDGVALYFDGHHLNPFGSRLVAPAFEPVMAQLAR